jgi:hypothetical protein
MLIGDILYNFYIFVLWPNQDLIVPYLNEKSFLFIQKTIYNISIQILCTIIYKTVIIHIRLSCVNLY